MRGSCLDASASFLARNVFVEGALEGPLTATGFDGLLYVFFPAASSPLRLALRLILAASKQHVTQLLGQQHLQLFGKHLLLFSSTAHTETTAARGARVLRDAPQTLPHSPCSASPQLTAASPLRRLRYRSFSCSLFAVFPAAFLAPLSCSSFP